MKYIQNISIESNISYLFNKQFEIFDFKNEQEILFLDDIKSFIIKKSHIDEQYSKSIISLCESYIKKNYQVYDNDIISSVSIPDYWKSVLETTINISEKKMVSCASIKMFCDLFSVIKEQKNSSYQKVLDYMKRAEDELTNIQNEFIKAYKVFETEILLSEKINNSSSVEQDLKKSKIDINSFNQTYKYINNSFEKPNRDRQIDLAKLNCLIIHTKLNKAIQHYFSSELPQLLQFQNGNMNLFIYEFIQSIFIKETETNDFISKMIKDFNKIDLSDLQNNPSLFENIVNFDYIVQFDKYKRLLNADEKINNCENVKYFSHEYEQLLSKSKNILTIIDENAKNTDFSIQDYQELEENKIGKMSSLPEAKLPKFIMNENLENQKFYLLEKNSQLKKLIAQIEFLEIFRINDFTSNNLAFTVEELACLNGRLDHMLTLESRFYIETLTKTIDKPFIDPDDYDITNEAWL